MNVRWISTVDFKISTDISPMGVALEPPRLIISPLSWSSVMIGDRYVTCYWGVYNWDDRYAELCGALYDDSFD